MPCPYFYPLRQLDPGDWDPAPRMPLGATFSGECRSPVLTQPEEAETQRELCNSGYARGLCPHFPADAPADAVRFSVVMNNGHSGAGGLICILEKDHAPLEYSRLRLDELDGDSQLNRDTLLAQARAFVSALKSS